LPRISPILTDKFQPMLLLVTDTSGKHGSVGLVRAESNEIKLIQSVPLAGGTFSAQLVPQIAELLQKHGFGKNEIDAFVVISGPGSFTGLRVGLAAIKALAEILIKPIAPVSLLEAIAASSNVYGKVIAAVDAGRGEVYAGEYEFSANGPTPGSEQLLPASEFISLARQTIVTTPDPALAEALREAGTPVSSVDYPTAEMIARIGWQRLQGGHTVTPEQLEANYIRRSDAEIFARK
jgi:tRNA threonylcarbamoyladenosine biosynthesis protein TsaB